MIYYIAREKNQNIFDEIVNERNLVITKNIRKTLRLDIFAKNEMRNLHAVTYLAIDINAVTISGIEELIGTLECYHLLNPSSQVIIIANSPEIETALLFDLKRNSRGRYFLITEDNKEKLKKELEQIFRKNKVENQTDGNGIILESLSEIGQEQEIEREKTEKDLLTQKAESMPQKISEDKPIHRIEKGQSKNIAPLNTEIKEKKINNIFDIPIEEEGQVSIPDILEETAWNWDCENVKIAFIGSENRVGTTTVAFQFADFLKRSNASVSYSEADESGHLKEMVEEYGLQIQKQNLFLKGGITYCEQGKLYDGVNFILVDFGMQSDKKIARLKKIQFEEIIVVSDYKPYSRNEVEKLNLLFPEANFVFTFVGEQEKKLLYEKRSKDAMILKSSQTLMQGELDNNGIFERIISKYRN